MPRYPCAGSCGCARRHTVTIPVVDAKTGQHLPTPLTFPAVLAATGQRCDTLPVFLAAVQALLPFGMRLSLGPDLSSLVIDYAGSQTPPASVGVWPKATVHVVRSTGGTHCPFVGPVTHGDATYPTIDALLASVTTSRAIYWPGPGDGCPVTVAYHPSDTAPGNITVTGQTTSTLIPLVTTRGTAAACPVNLPVWRDSDGARHATLQSLAAAVQATLGAGYTVAVTADGCSLIAQHSSFLTPPSPVVVRETATATIPVNTNSVPTCPVPFPVRLTPNGVAYPDLAALTAAWVATKGAMWEAAPYGACNIRVTYPATQTAPLAVDAYASLVAPSSWSYARSQAGGDVTTLNAAVFPTDPLGAARLLTLAAAWPLPPPPAGARTAQLGGLVLPAGVTTPQRVTVTAHAPTAKVALWDRGANPNNGHDLIPVSALSGGTITGSGKVVNPADADQFTATWIVSGINPANLVLTIAAVPEGRQAAILDVRVTASDPLTDDMLYAYYATDAYAAGLP